MLTLCECDKLQTSLTTISLSYLLVLESTAINCTATHRKKNLTIHLSVDRSELISWKPAHEKIKKSYRNFNKALFQSLITICCFSKVPTVHRDKNVEKIFAVHFRVVSKTYAKTRANKTGYHWLFMTDHASSSFINQICLGWDTSIKFIRVYQN